jgi:hypothetical protein
MTINELIRTEVRKVMVNAFWYQAPAQAPTYYATIDIVSDASILDKDLSIPNAISTLRVQVSMYGTDAVCLRQYARMMKEHMRKVSHITSEDTNVTLHKMDYIVGMEGFVADAQRFFQSMDFYVKYTAKEIALTPEELDAICGNDEVYGEDITPSFRKVNLHSNLMSADAFDPDAPLAGWTPPDTPRLNDTVVVAFNDGLAFYTYNGSAWVFNIFYAGGNAPPQPVARKFLQFETEEESKMITSFTVLNVLNYTDKTFIIEQDDDFFTWKLECTDPAFFDSHLVMISEHMIGENVNDLTNYIPEFEYNPIDKKYKKMILDGLRTRYTIEFIPKPEEV